MTTDNLEHIPLREYTESRRIRSTGSSTRRLEEDQTETVGVGMDWRKTLGDSQLLTWGIDADYDDVDSTRNNVNINNGATTSVPGTFAPGSNYLSSGVFLRDEPRREGGERGGLCECGDGAGNGDCVGQPQSGGDGGPCRVECGGRNLVGLCAHGGAEG